jgi:hypothetical protein
MNNEENHTSPVENPKRASVIIAAAKIVGFPVDQLGALVLDALDTDHDTSLFPVYNVLPDRENADPRAFMIYMIQCLAGSDDDHDYLSHDLDHLTDSTDECPAHGTKCATCCEPCMSDD